MLASEIAWVRSRLHFRNNTKVLQYQNPGDIMYRVVERSGKVLKNSERERISEAVHLARETEHMEAEIETEYYVQVQQKGEWKAVDNADLQSVVTENKNGTLYSFSGEGFTVHLQEQEGGEFRVVSGIVAISPQDAIDKSKLWLGCCGFTIAKVYPGNDGWYATEECVYEANNRQ